MSTRLYEHPIFLEHVTPAGHPERSDRIRAINVALEHPNFERLERRQAPQANEDAVLLAHPEEHLIAVMREIPEEEGEINQIEADTYASSKSLQAALTGIGGAMAAVDDVFTGRADNVFVAARPPGHHAEKMTAMGFCFFNNAAIAARHAQRAHGAERIAIVDWDVHHGNGTQDIFWDDASVLFCSTHQMPLYPGTGAKDEKGTHNTIVNAPLSPNVGSDHFREAFKSRVLPALDDFRPDLIIISAGFDAHHRDPLAQINLTGEDFDWATGRVLELADRHAKNRVVSLLEGGYDLEGLAESAGMHILRMMKG
ncbi:histone deacetylase family protein [Rhizobium leguminosarum]|jgi:acetoin utilization deacetylase AcuC-like enzyme|uniref:Histone deacetylase family protein n=1 Tax=Rhizobium leguminosarum TaxID=384 RepID=A0A444HYJ6_RHILE|nr:histone deacetylase family protein [Rhizobium leguminosarum]MDH6659816.1 acetoin utilization deacetylase AcuC-like enzyme [Rhizobium sophorae]ASS54196.1 acetoin utilization protein [Rhizobium leguminosarum bv. viciae]AVC48524.1 histone deacetylase domain protein [Rhizobium leguminosarum bv. viciae]MBB4329092.1 acetoin utilization deacetylase AcuC-like enzyme [Rhizobium leguminosarum]MBB4344597.1 acetoin utilization deacetylase AcuC-like enzyme [Rhizobium leguminosarum]